MKSSSKPSAVRWQLSLYMHGAFFLTGVGVLMLGPLLPLFGQVWQLADGQKGMMLAAQFAGSFCGAILLRTELRKSLTIGSTSLLVGYTSLSLAAGHTAGFVAGIASLFVGGFGIGQLVNSVCLIAARRAREKRGASLMSLNLTWSAGALLAPLLIGLARHVLSLRAMLSVFAFGSAILLILQWSVATGVWTEGAPRIELVESSAGETSRGNTRSLLIYFSVIFFLYGALENSVSGWIATFAVRYTHSSAAVGAYSTAALWAGITMGRGFGLVLLRRFSERSIQVAAVIATIIAATLLRSASHAEVLLPLAVTLGCGLAPFIPLTSSLFLNRTPTSPRQAGFVMATPALGGAVLALLIGLLSQHYQSLKLALELPPLVGVVLLAGCLVQPPRVLAEID